MKILFTTDGATQTTLALQAAGRLLRNHQHQADDLCILLEERS